MAKFTITAIRDTVIDYTAPFWYEPAVIVMKQPEENSLLVYLGPFKPEVWYLVISSIPFTALALTFIIQLQDKIRSGQRSDVVADEPPTTPGNGTVTSEPIYTYENTYSDFHHVHVQGHTGGLGHVMNGDLKNDHGRPPGGRVYNRKIKNRRRGCMARCMATVREWLDCFQISLWFTYGAGMQQSESNG